MALITILSGCVAREPVHKSWAWEIGLKVRDCESLLGAPFNLVKGRRSWSWHMGLAWVDESPLCATLRLADEATILQDGSRSILRFDLPPSPARISVHVIPVHGEIPQANDVVFVVECPDQIYAAAMPNPFRKVSGGSPGVAPIELGDPAVPENSCQLELIRVNTASEVNRSLYLYLEIAEGRMQLAADAGPRDGT